MTVGKAWCHSSPIELSPLVVPWPVFDPHIIQICDPCDKTRLYSWVSPWNKTTTIYLLIYGDPFPWGIKPYSLTHPVTADSVPLMEVRHGIATVEPVHKGCGLDWLTKSGNWFVSPGILAWCGLGDISSWGNLMELAGRETCARNCAGQVSEVVADRLDVVPNKGVKILGCLIWTVRRLASKRNTNLLIDQGF